MRKINSICLVSEQNSVNDVKLQRFYADVATGFIELNALIEKYNSENDTVTKRDYLYQLYLKQKALSHQFPQRMIESCPEYQQKIYHQLFTEIKDEFTYLGITSLQENTLQAQLMSKSVECDPTSLPEIIANIAPEKVDSLLKILSEGSRFNPKDLINLYSPQETGYKEFQAFLEAHSINYLGGGNSHNFKIINLFNGQALVLKIDYRVHYPRHADTHLRKSSLQNICTPIRAERDGSFTNKYKNLVTRSLLVTDFCQGTDLEHYADRPRFSTDLISLVLKIYIQMATILRNIIKDGCAFTDMKNSNWLIDNDTLKLADTKSFLFVNECGILDMSIPENYWFDGITGTHDLNPPELKTTPPSPSPADKIHAFILGRNLYQFLTNKALKALSNVTGTMPDFSEPIFATPMGTSLRELIEKLTQEDPDSRSSINDAINELNKIKIAHQFLLTMEQHKQSLNDTEIEGFIEEGLILITQTTTSSDLSNLEIKLEELQQKVLENVELRKLKETCKVMLDQIKTLQFGTHDLEMANFICTKTKDINNKTTKDELQLIKQELSNFKTKTATNLVIEELHTIIATFRSDCRFYTVGMNAKALKIEEAMAKVPLHERVNIAHKQSSLGHMVLRELASHRHIFRANPVTKTGEIDGTKAANTYRLFTKKFPQTQMNTLHETSINVLVR